MGLKAELKTSILLPRFLLLLQLSAVTYLGTLASLC